jgi:hypothetical protein
MRDCMAAVGLDLPFSIFASPEREMFALFASSSWDIPSLLRQRRTVLPYSRE